tara:strand:+ start:191 stop:514 length:324 start_codon:yes stop_codon:yes gene_type:complete
MGYKMKSSVDKLCSPLLETDNKVYESEGGNEQVKKKKGLAKVGSRIKTALTGKVGKKYKVQGTIRQDVTKKKAKKNESKGKENVTFDGGKTNAEIVKRGAWDAKTKK